MLKTKTTKMLLSGLLAMTFASCAMPTTTKDTKKAETSSEDSLDDVDRFISDGVKNQFKDFGAEINVTLASISQLSGTTNVDARILAASAKTIPNPKCKTKTPPPPANRPDPKVMELEQRLNSMNMAKKSAEGSLARMNDKTPAKAKEGLKNQINMMTTQIADVEKQIADLKAKLKATPPVAEFDSPACVAQREAFHKDLKIFEAELNAKATKPTPPAKQPAPTKPANEPDDENETELEDEKDTNGKSLTPPAPPANGKFPQAMMDAIKNAKSHDAPLPDLTKRFPIPALLEAGYTQAEIDLALKGIFVPKAMLDTIKDYKSKNRPLVEFVKQFPPQGLEMAGYTKAEIDAAVKALSAPPPAGKFPPAMMETIKDFKAKNRPLAQFVKQFPPQALIEAGYTQAEIDAAVKSR